MYILCTTELLVYTTLYLLVSQSLIITSFLYLASSLGFLLAFDMKKLMVMLSSQVSVMDWWRWWRWWRTQPPVGGLQIVNINNAPLHCILIK